jgi:hypothetical protein
MKYKIELDTNFKNSVKNEFLKEFDIHSALFENPDFRDFITKYRYENMLEKSFQYLESEKSSEVTISHNTDPERMFYSEMSRRPDLIALPLRCLNSVKQNAHTMKVATIGCRTEAEIFSLVNAGFNPKNISGYDLFTNSPLIDLGDITEMNVKDDVFDITVCGWVLEFVTDLNLAASELLRITKNGGLIAIGGMHHPNSLNIDEYSKRKKHQDREWYCSLDSVKELFQINDCDIVFKSDIDSLDLDKRGDVVIIFKVNK